MAYDAENPPVVSLTSPATLTFPNLLEPRAVKGPNGKPNGEPKFSVNLEFNPDHPDLGRIKAKAAEVARAKWPGRDLRELAVPWTSGDKLAAKAKAKGKNREFSEGKVVVTARSKFRPTLSFLEGGKIVELEDDSGIKANIRKFYSGCDVLAEVRLQAYDGVGQNPDGVNAYINQVMSLNRGKKVAGGGKSATETFKDVVGKFSAEDPTEGAEYEPDEASSW